MPPAAMTGSAPSSAATSVRSVASARPRSGAPESPPCSDAWGRPSTPSRASVVFVAIAPSIR